jgi:hypothetical protein
MGGSIQTIYYDQEQNSIINGSNVGSAIKTTTYPKPYVSNEHFIIRMYVYQDAANTTKANLAALTFTGKIGNAGETAIITSDNADFNVGTDWSAINTTAGQICVFINTQSSTLIADLGTQNSKQYLFNITGTDSNSDDRTVAQYPIVILNAPK